MDKSLSTQKMENSRLMLEIQSKELKVMLDELESSNRAEAKAAIATLESKASILEEQLFAEAQDRTLVTKANRKLRKKINDLLMQLQDERRHADQYKKQNEKTIGRMKGVRRQLDEAEEEINTEKANGRKAQQELDNYIESNECMNREINNLKNKLTNVGNSSGRTDRHAELSTLIANRSDMMGKEGMY